MKTHIGKHWVIEAIVVTSIVATLGGLLVIGVQNTRNAVRRTQDI